MRNSKGVLFGAFSKFAPNKEQNPASQLKPEDARPFYEGSSSNTDAYENPENYAVSLKRSEGGYGMGFLIAPNILVTSNHSIMNLKENSLTLNGKPTRIIDMHRDFENDIAVLFLENPVQASVLCLATKPPYKGQKHIAAAYITDKTTKRTKWEKDKLIYKGSNIFEALFSIIKDTPYNFEVFKARKGYSGTPIINNKGHVVSIVISGVTTVAGYNISAQGPSIEVLRKTIDRAIAVFDKKGLFASSDPSTIPTLNHK